MLADGLRALNYRESLPVFTSLQDWGKHFFPHYCKLPFGKHHNELGVDLWKLRTERGQKLAYQAPRSYAKSTFISFFFPILAACEKFEKYILILGDTAPNAIKYLKQIRTELEINVELARAYPEACGVGPEWNDASLLLRNGVRIEALSTGQKIRGRKQMSDRPGLIVGDDLQGDEAQHSQTVRDHDWEWFEKGVMYAGASHTNFVVAGTSIHLECIVSKILTDKEASLGWTGRIYRALDYPTRMDLWAAWKNIICNIANPARMADAVAFYIAHRSDMDAGAVMLWEENENPPDARTGKVPFPSGLFGLMTQWARSPSSFESEKRNNPIDPSKCEWPADLFEGVGFDTWPRNLKYRAIGVDPSHGAKDQSGDDCAIIMLGVGEDGLLYVDADLEPRFIEGPNGVIDRVLQLCDYFKPDVIGVESDQCQHLIGSRIQQESAARGWMPLPVVPIATEGVPKPVRIRRLGPYIGMRSVRFKNNSAGVIELIRQLKMFNGSNDGKDDGPDGVEITIRALQKYVDYRDTERIRQETEHGAVLAPLGEIPI